MLVLHGSSPSAGPTSPSRAAPPDVEIKCRGERLPARSIDNAQSVREERLRTLGRSGLASQGRTRIGRRTFPAASAQTGHEFGEGLGGSEPAASIARVLRSSPLRPCVAHRQTVLGGRRLARRRGTLIRAIRFL